MSGASRPKPLSTRASRRASTFSGSSASGCQTRGPGGKAKAVRHDANHDRRYTVDADGASEHAGVGAIAMAPDRSAENHDGNGTATVIVGNEIATEQGSLPQQREGVGRDVGADKSFQPDPLVAEVHRHFPHGAEAFECLAGGSPILKIGIGHAGA